MQRMFAETSSTPRAAAPAEQQPQLGTRPAPVPPWELVLQLGLQTLHRWQTGPQSVSLNRLQPGQLDALLCLASMPSTPDSCRHNDQEETKDLKASVSEHQQDLAQLLQQLQADLIAASGAAPPQPNTNWVCRHVVQRVLTTKGLSSSKSSDGRAAKLLQIAAHFLLQYTQQAKQASTSSDGVDDLLMLLWADFIACARRDQSQLSGSEAHELFVLPR